MSKKNHQLNEISYQKTKSLFTPAYNILPVSRYKEDTRDGIICLSVYYGNGFQLSRISLSKGFCFTAFLFLPFEATFKFDSTKY